VHEDEPVGTPRRAQRGADRLPVLAVSDASAALARRGLWKKLNTSKPAASNAVKSVGRRRGCGWRHRATPIRWGNVPAASALSDGTVQPAEAMALS
jgi:hypothetical protein